MTDITHWGPFGVPQFTQEFLSELEPDMDCVERLTRQLGINLDDIVLELPKQ